MQDSHRAAPLRQWQLTLSEVPREGVYLAALRWRTFPCREDEWHGFRAAQIFSLGPRVSSPEDLEAVLALFVEVHWDLTAQDTARRGHQSVD